MKDKPNIIFLDIDGVLNTCVSPNFKDRHFDVSSVEFLNKAIKDYNCQVVISSTWRHGSDYLDFSQLLHVAGVGRGVVFCAPYENYQDRTEYHKNSWRTPNINDGVRGDEIQWWLDTYGEYINNYVILDDDSDMLGSQLDNFVNTDHFTGIGYREYLRMGLILGEQEDHPHKRELSKTISWYIKENARLSRLLEEK